MLRGSRALRTLRQKTLGWARGGHHMLVLLLTSPRMALGGPGAAWNVGTLPALPSGPAGCTRRSDENTAKQQTLPAAALCPEPCGALGAVLVLRSLRWGWDKDSTGAKVHQEKSTGPVGHQGHGVHLSWGDGTGES